MADIQIKRTTTADPDFISLINLLDNELWNELNEDQATYDQHNKVPDIDTAIVVYSNSEVAACGCFKQYKPGTAEIKRMYVKKAFRGIGLSKVVLQQLEKWAKEKGFTNALLETSIHFTVAKSLYATNGYRTIPDYPPYNGLDESICMEKRL